MSDLVALPLRRVSHWVLLPRCWSLRENLTIYDASYSPWPSTLAQCW